VGYGGGSRLWLVLLVIDRDLKQGLLHQGAYPHADVGGHYVHQAKAGDHLEAVDVQLEMRNPKSGGELRKHRERERENGVRRALEYGGEFHGSQVDYIDYL